MQIRLSTTMKILIFYVIIILLAAMGFSCTTKRLQKSTKIETFDSSSASKKVVDVKNTIDTGTLKKADKTEIKESEGTFDKKTVIEFSPEFDKDEDNGISIDKDYAINPKDMIKAPVDTSVWRDNNLFIFSDKSKVVIKNNGDIELKVLPKSITTQEKGSTKTKETKIDKSIDSSHGKITNDSNATEEKKTDVSKTKKETNKSSKRTSYWGWLWIGLGVAAVLFLGWYFKIWPWFIALIRKLRNRKK